jgi:hypothetical protein
LAFRSAYSLDASPGAAEVSDEHPTQFDGFKCPQCNYEFDVHAVAKMREESVLHFRMSPAPGELLDARTIGDTLSQVRNLLKSFGKDAGVPTDVLVKSATTLEDGTVDFELIVVRFEKAEARSKRFAARRAAK